MTIKVMNCPTCGHPLPPDTKQNELVTCPACHNTLYLSDWQIGYSKDAVAVATPTRVYRVSDLVGKDDLCNIYRAIYTVEGKDWQGMFRVARNTADNDLIQNEAQILYHLQSSKDFDEFHPFIPIILDSFVYQDASLDGARRVNIFGLHEGIHAPNELYTLEEVNKHYPNGIDPRDMAWIWRRLLYVLGFVHHSGVVHGGIVPSNVMIEPKDHKLFLGGWGFSVRLPAPKMSALSLDYEKWYPASVFERKPPKTEMDIIMAARCMMYLIGIDPLDDTPQHRNLESELQSYFSRCIKQPQEAWRQLEVFDKTIGSLWGKRTFRVFTMPYK